MPRFSYTKKLMVYGYVNDGDTVHYVDKSTNDRLLDGRIAENGILVAGQPGPVSLAKFEALAGRYMVKAPTKYIILPSGKTMEMALNEIKRKQNEEKKAKEQAAGARPGARRGRKPKQGADVSTVVDIATMLTEDENDQFCVYCGHDGEVVELLKCASCPTVMHASCPTVEDIFRASGATGNGGEEIVADNVDDATVSVENAKRKKAGRRTNRAGAGTGVDEGMRREISEPTEPATSGAMPQWHCPACRCCVCGKELDSLDDQYRGAVYVTSDPDVRYVDILDSALHKRLHVRNPAPEAEGGASTGLVEEGVQGEREERSYSDIDTRGVMNGVQDADIDMHEAIPPPPPPPAETSLLVSPSGSRAHATCSEQFASGMENGEPFDMGGDRMVFEALAKACLRGATSIGRYSNSIGVSFQMIHAASATSQPVYGIAPMYTNKQRASLRKIISAGWAVIKDSYEEIWDSRTGVNLAPMMLQGMSKLPFVDYSGMHIAVLFMNSTVVSVACFRILGPVAEVPIVATRRELRGIKAGSTLLARLDYELHMLGVKALVTQGTYKEGPQSFYPYTPSLNPPGAPLPPPGQEVFGFKLARKEYVLAVVSRGGFSVPGITWVECETGRWTNWQTWSSKLLKIKVELNSSADLRSRLSLLMIRGVSRHTQMVALPGKVEVKKEADMPTEAIAKTAIRTGPKSMPNGVEEDEAMDMEETDIMINPMKNDVDVHRLPKSADVAWMEGTAGDGSPEMDACVARQTPLSTHARISDAEQVKENPGNNNANDDQLVVKTLVDKIISTILTNEY